MATRCAQHHNATVFCPPLATFDDPQKASEQHLVNGLALSVECDSAAYAAREKLEELLGPATFVVASGGKWTNTETSEVEDKLHLHWRLTEPTRALEEHKRLKEARTLATALVGGDASNHPIVHPIRWPGSWHRKRSPVLARIINETQNEIELTAALEKLRAATTAAGLNKNTCDDSPDTSPQQGERRETDRLVQEILEGSDYHNPLVSLSMRYIKGGMSDPQAILTLRGIMSGVPIEHRDMKDGALHPGRWKSRFDDIPRLVASARSKVGDVAAVFSPEFQAGELFSAADFTGFPPQRRWVVSDWIPEGCVTGVFGPGGSGKSLLAQMMATVLSANVATMNGADGESAVDYDWVGLSCIGCPVLAYFCEDDKDELHRRQASINYQLGIDDTETELKNFHMRSRVGMSNLLMIFYNGVGTPTPFYDQIVADIAETSAKVVILDNVAQLFGGNENDRGEVTQFVNLLHKIANEHDVTPILLGHPAKGIGSEYSGSTAWDACFRGRIYLGRPSGKDDENNNDDAADFRVMRKSKANYGRVGEEKLLQCCWIFHRIYRVLTIISHRMYVLRLPT